MLKLSIKEGGNVNANEGFALRRAIELNNVKMVALLLKNGADPNVYRHSSIRLAVRHNNTKIAKLLIDAGADINEENGFSLLFAAINGNVEMVKILISPNNKGKNIKKKVLRSTIKSIHGYSLIPNNANKYTEIINVLTNKLKG